MAKKSTNGSCKLCLKQGPIKKSHIIPEFFYKPMYDEKHRFIQLKLEVDAPDMPIQKGIRDRLLCQECETLMSKWEGYVRHLIFSRPDEIDLAITLERQGAEVVARGIDYTTLKLFQLSIIWRASVSSLKFFHSVDLGPHTENIRLKLLNGKVGDPYEYPCIMNMVMVNPNKMLTEVIVPPDEGSRLLGAKAYKFIFGGFAWYYVIASHRLSSIPAKWLISKYGEVRFPMMDAKEEPSLSGIVDDFMKKKLNLL